MILFVPHPQRVQTFEPVILMECGRSHETASRLYLPILTPEPALEYIAGKKREEGFSSFKRTWLERNILNATVNPFQP